MSDSSASLDAIIERMARDEEDDLNHAHGEGLLAAAASLASPERREADLLRALGQGHRMKASEQDDG